MTKASRDTQGGRKEREKERKKERGRERERREKRKRQVFPATNKHPGTHRRKRGVILSVAFRKTPGSKERKGEGRGKGRGRKGLRSQQVPMNLKNTLTAVVTLCPAEAAGCFDRCGHVKA